MNHRDTGEPRQIAVLGTPLVIANYPEMIEYCRRWTTRPACTAVEFTNTQVVTMRRCERDFITWTSRYDYFVPDGMPLVWCLNARGARMPDRVYGPTFMRRCISATPAPATHYLLGGSEALGQRLREVIVSWNPDVRIVGSYHGVVTSDGRLADDGDDRLVEEINRLSPDYVWVGLGTPKQQAWIYRNKPKLKRGVMLGVGFAFDVNGGTKKDAPQWMQRLGLTWVYRLVSEPRRLFGRYARYNSLFVAYLLMDFFFPVKPRSEQL